MTDAWLQAINDGRFVACVLVDFRKAFDLVDHKLHLQKLKQYKIKVDRASDSMMAPT